MRLSTFCGLRRDQEQPLSPIASQSHSSQNIGRVIRSTVADRRLPVYVIQRTSRCWLLHLGFYPEHNWLIRLSVRWKNDACASPPSSYVFLSWAPFDSISSLLGTQQILSRIGFEKLVQLGRLSLSIVRIFSGRKMISNSGECIL
jgi:hypothetical protein